MGAVFTAVIALLTSQASVSLLMAAGIFGILTIVIPTVMSLLTGYTSGANLSSLFSYIPNGIYWALYFFRLDFGLPALLSAAVTRFLIRLIPFR